METEYNSYRLGLTKRRADCLVNWLRATVKGWVSGRFAVIALNWDYTQGDLGGGQALGPRGAG